MPEFFLFLVDTLLSPDLRLDSIVQEISNGFIWLSQSEFGLLLRGEILLKSGHFLFGHLSRDAQTVADRDGRTEDAPDVFLLAVWRVNTCKARHPGQDSKCIALAH